MKVIDIDRFRAEIERSKLMLGMSVGKRIQWEDAMDRATVESPNVVHCHECKYCFSLTHDPMEPWDGECEWYCEVNDRDYNVHARDPMRYYCANGDRREDRE